MPRFLVRLIELTSAYFAGAATVTASVASQVSSGPVTYPIVWHTPCADIYRMIITGTGEKWFTVITKGDPRPIQVRVLKGDFLSPAGYAGTVTTGTGAQCRTHYVELGNGPSTITIG